MADADSIFKRALLKLLIEIFEGPPGGEAYLLNPGDPGLLRQLESCRHKQAKEAIEAALARGAALAR